jgi:hypothetical protein
MASGASGKGNGLGRRNRVDRCSPSPRMHKLVLERVLAHRTRQEDERKLAGSAWCETGMVFAAHKGTLLEPRNMLREYYRLRHKAHLPKIRFHDLRHSAATILNMAGIPDEVIQKLLGHASVRTTQEIYMHLTPGAEKRAASKMDEIFGPVAVKTAESSETGVYVIDSYGAPEVIRTPDLLVRSQTLYPTELRAHGSVPL